MYVPDLLLSAHLLLLYTAVHCVDGWPQVGNSGMFRPEMLRPMGLPEDVNVIAWGLSLVGAGFGSAKECILA